ncbi:hypothetical protein [Hyphomonas sp.]|uniref:hypothetical protein n=1 Tax=Hyphomonas sp. TaxID=87 RepID=UPI003918D459
MLAAILTAAAAGQKIHPFYRDRVVCGLEPDKGGSGLAGKRRDRGACFGSEVDQLGAGGHDENSFDLLVCCFVVSLAGSSRCRQKLDNPDHIVFQYGIIEKKQM